MLIKNKLFFFFTFFIIIKIKNYSKPASAKTWAIRFGTDKFNESLFDQTCKNIKISSTLTAKIKNGTTITIGKKSTPNLNIKNIKTKNNFFKSLFYPKQ